jgi:hypothetical protein
MREADDEGTDGDLRTAESTTASRPGTRVPHRGDLQGEGSWVGLYQRMIVGTITLWLILVAFRLRSIAGAAATNPGKSTRNLPGRLGVAKRTRRDRTDATDGSKGSGVGDA